MRPPFTVDVHNLTLFVLACFLCLSGAQHLPQSVKKDAAPAQHPSGVVINPNANFEHNERADTSAKHAQIAPNQTVAVKNATEENNKGSNAHYGPNEPSDDDLLSSGALLRGFYVFIGFSLILLIYFAIKSYRLRKRAPQSTHVSKYGVRARRGDVEMLPLPLDEDDEDDTVFDIGNHTER